MMTHDEQAVAALAKALAHPARSRIPRLLQATPGCIGGTIVDATGLAQSTICKDLRILKTAGVISGEFDGPRICYALHPNAVGAMTGLMTRQIDWIPLSLGAVRPTQGTTLAVLQASGGSQSLIAVNQMRILGALDAADHDPDPVVVPPGRFRNSMRKAG